jgi:hypothetical protein
MEIKMKDKVAVIVLVLTLVATMIPMSAFASQTDEPEITSVKELVQEIKGEVNENNELSLKETNTKINNTSPDVIAEYKVLAVKEMISTLQDTPPVYINTGNEREVITTVEELIPGVNLKSTFIDEPETNIASNILNDISNIFIEKAYAITSGSASLSKKYGNRQYTATYEIVFFSNNAGTGLRPGKICLVSHYNISDKGLVLKSADVTGTSMWAYGDITADKPVLSDKKAEKAVSNIDCWCQYKISISQGGYQLYSGYVKLINYVRLDKLDKKNKTANLTQHWDFRGPSQMK